MQNDSLLQPGQLVRFKLRDVHLPAIEDVLNRMTEDTQVQGFITLLSNPGGAQGSKKGPYAVVEVKGILTPVIVPTARAIVEAA